MNYCRLLVLFIILSFFGSSLTYAETVNIDRLVFTNDDLSASPGDLSGAIRVETQNSAGTAEKVDETNDVVFRSSSNTGQFLNDKEGLVSTTMSKNTSSRTFYYKDSKEGEHTITVTITGRDSGETFIAETSIEIGKDLSPTSSSSQSSSGSTKSSAISSHSGQTAVSEMKSKTGFKVDAGRPRLTTAYTPIEFLADASEAKSLGSQLKFYWSFGDGTSGRGNRVSHAYQFPGDYTVILNSSFSRLDFQERAVARTEVKVIDPEISIKSVKPGTAGYIELENGSDFEVNLGGWVFNSGESRFAIAPDTLIKPHSKLRLPSSWLVNAETLSLLYPQNVVAASYIKEKPQIEYSESLARQRSEILERIVALKKELARNSSPNMVVEAVSPLILSEPAESETNTSDTDQSAALLKAFEESEGDGQNQGVNGRVVDFFRDLFGR